MLFPHVCPPAHHRDIFGRTLITIYCVIIPAIRGVLCKKKSPKYFYLKKLNIKEWSLRPGDNLIPQYNWKIDTALWYWICFMDDNRYLPRIDHYILDSFQGLLQVSEVSRKCRKMSIIFLIADVFIRELLLHHIIQYQWLKSPLRQNLLSQRNRKPAIQLRH